MTESERSLTRGDQEHRQQAVREDKRKLTDEELVARLNEIGYSSP